MAPSVIVMVREAVVIGATRNEKKPDFAHCALLHPHCAYLHIYLFTYLLSVKTASVAGRWSAPIFLSAAALLRTECDHVPPPLAVLHTPNMGPVSSWEYVWISGEMLQPRNCVQQWIYRESLLVMRYGIIVKPMLEDKWWWVVHSQSCDCEQG